MRRLSKRAATRCEEATNPRCRCRCGGALHGAKRGATDSLPLTDPHSTQVRPKEKADEPTQA